MCVCECVCVCARARMHVRAHAPTRCLPEALAVHCARSLAYKVIEIVTSLSHKLCLIGQHSQSVTPDACFTRKCYKSIAQDICSQGAGGSLKYTKL